MKALNLFLIIIFFFLSNGLVCGDDSIADRKNDVISLGLDSSMKVLKGDLSGAYEDCLKILKIDPNNISALISAGQIKIKLGDEDAGREYVNQALVLIEGSLQKEPNDAKMYILRGQANSALNDYDKAIEDMKRALELDPENLGYKNNLRSVEFEKKKYLKRNQVD